MKRVEDRILVDHDESRGTDGEKEDNEPSYYGEPALE
jgi:hypothetical protein